MSVDVRHRRGAPITADFNSADGTPIVLDTETGRAYILDSNNDIRWINRRMYVHTGSGTPPPIMGEDGDLFISTTGWWWEKDDGIWSQISNSIGPVGPQGPVGPAGPVGANGANGSNGINGLNGSQIYTGIGVPSSGIGVSGDIYINTSNGDLYQRTTVWGSAIGNIRGPQGIPGTAGTVVDVASTSGTSASVTTTSGQEIMVLAVGDWIPGLLFQTITLTLNGIIKDTKGVLTGLLSGRTPFSLAFVDSPAPGTHAINVSASGGTLANVNILVTKVG